MRPKRQEILRLRLLEPWLAENWRHAVDVVLLSVCDTLSTSARVKYNKKCERKFTFTNRYALNKKNIHVKKNLQPFFVFLERLPERRLRSFFISRPKSLFRRCYKLREDSVQRNDLIGRMKTVHNGVRVRLIRTCDKGK